MPVNVNAGPSKLKITYSAGVDTDGKEIKKSKTYANVKAVAGDQDVYDVADAIIGLQQHGSLYVGRINEVEMTEA